MYRFNINPRLPATTVEAVADDEFISDNDFNAFAMLMIMRLSCLLSLCCAVSLWSIRSGLQSRKRALVVRCR